METEVKRRPHDCAQAIALSRLVTADQLDMAIDVGLMVFVPCPACEPAPAMQLLEVQRKLADAWAARDRYRLRKLRLARQVADRQAQRVRNQVPTRNTLPASVAAVLARAKAKAAERGSK